MKDTSRREFLKAGMYGTAAGIAMTGGVIAIGAEKANAAVSFPFGYPETGLDVEITRQLGYDGYKGITVDGQIHKDCAFGAFNAIISQLAEIVGAPYSLIPRQMMEWASGGVAGFATFCGALNGACAAIGLICGNSDAKKFPPVQVASIIANHLILENDFVYFQSNI